ncbi:hypothetical protein P389DRAFT_63494 [Cystobasidium minutum MCA 4210]|uniref:uncharacterized protein n=1 Tax=Cystobasidium minutum MCA 4210 TaxID=1397322 RepID=UPI0034CFB7BA|eukprot:jgi/Rhomi1/63494/CE63493_13234
MTSPSSKKDHSHDDAHSKKEKFKPHLRLPPGVEETDAEAAKQPEVPEELKGLAGEGRPHGEGDHGLRAQQENSHEHQDKQKQGSDFPTTGDNHSTDSGLKGNAAKFNAAARGSQIANQSGGGEAARNTKAITQAGKEAGSEAEQGQPKETGYSSGTTPANAGEKIGKHLTQDKDANSSEESDKEDSGEAKAEQQ